MSRDQKLIKSMKNPITIFASISIVAVLGVGAYLLFQSSSQSKSMIPGEDTTMESKTDNAMMQKDTDNMEKDDKMAKDTMSDSRYVEYSKASLDKAGNNRRVLYFYASWCPTCKPADADLEANKSRIPNDVTVIRVNYNDPETDQEEKELAKKYGITYQHTFVQIDSQGNEVTKWNGGKTDELIAKIK